MPLAEVVFAEPSFEVETEYKVELLQALQWCLEVLRWLCESCFQKYTAWRRLLVQYVYIRRNSSCCKRSWKRTAHTVPSYCIPMHHKGTWLTRKYMNNKILLLPHYSNKHRFAISLDAFKFWSVPKDLDLCNQTLSCAHALGMGMRLYPPHYYCDHMTPTWPWMWHPTFKSHDPFMILVPPSASHMTLTWVCWSSLCLLLQKESKVVGEVCSQLNLQCNFLWREPYVITKHLIGGFSSVMYYLTTPTFKTN